MIHSWLNMKSKSKTKWVKHTIIEIFLFCCGNATSFCQINRELCFPSHHIFIFYFSLCFQIFKSTVCDPRMWLCFSPSDFRGTGESSFSSQQYTWQTHKHNSSATLTDFALVLSCSADLSTVASRLRGTFTLVPLSGLFRLPSNRLAIWRSWTHSHTEWLPQLPLNYCVLSLLHWYERCSLWGNILASQSVICSASRTQNRMYIISTP